MCVYIQNIYMYKNHEQGVSPHLTLAGMKNPLSLEKSWNSTSSKCAFLMVQMGSALHWTLATRPMYVCMYVCMHACMHACMYVHILVFCLLMFSGYSTLTGRKFALVEGLSHDLVCAGSNYHVHFAWQVWHGQYSPRFKSNKLKSFSRVEIDRNHVDLKDSRGKGFALRRLNKHNFCPASLLLKKNIFVFMFICFVFIVAFYIQY